MSTDITTAGYDAVIIVNAKLINEASTALFYNNFLTFNKEIDFKEGPHALPNDIITKIPNNLKSFLKVRLRCKLLHEPMIMFEKQANKENVMIVSTHLRLYIWMMDGLELKFDADLTLKGQFHVESSNESQTLCFPLKADLISQFDMAMADSESSLDIKNVQNHFRPVLNEYFEKISPIKIALPGFSTYFPRTGPHTPENRFDVRLATISVLDAQQVAIAFNILNHKNGDEKALRPYCQTSTVALAVSERALKSAFNFYCDRFTPRDFNIEGHKEHWSATALGWTISTIDHLISSIKTKITSLGYKERHYHFHNAKYYGNVRLVFLKKPEINFKPGNIIEIKSLPIKLRINVGIEVNYERVTEKDPTGFLPDCVPDKVISRENVTEHYGIPEFDIEPHIKKASAEFKLEEGTNALVMNFKKLEFSQIFQHQNWVEWLTDEIATGLTNWIAELIVNKLPGFYLTPPLSIISLPTVKWPISVSHTNFEFGNGAVKAAIGLQFPNLKAVTSPMPKYVANVNNKEVHRIGCPCIMDTYETHQKGFYSLQQALRAGFDGCKNCLPAYHKR